MKLFALSCLLVVLSQASALADTDLAGVRWQFSPGLKPAVKHKFGDVRSVKIPADGKLQGRLRAVVTLENKSGKNSDGIVLRVSVSARIVKISAPEKEGVWDLPFRLDERRVAFLKAGARKEASIPNIELQKYLKRLQKTGYWVDALKIRLVPVPRAGEDFGANLGEAVLAVTR